ncbi:MAG: carboxylating nicotinate-nucleotide diphosphorylase [Desulfovibrionaceae bacterium]|nr:carboxylating nicotinate-nucleotide diphosphorylase [Desulfovibrionaceae bacterium]
MSFAAFDAFFSGDARRHLLAAIELALSEDGPDLTSLAVFSPHDVLRARIVAKQDSLVAGLPIAPLALSALGALAACDLEFPVDEGARVATGTVVCRMTGPAVALLKSERVILNFISHLSGVANLTARYVAALSGTGARLLDTRKTLPGLRYPEKYAVTVGGGVNHRTNLTDMLMLKDNHIDRAGGIPQAMAALRKAYENSMETLPPVEIECRSLAEVAQAVAERPARIMFDNMDPAAMRQAREAVPPGIETEASGGVDLDSIAAVAASGVDFVSVGRITHSAPAADFSMQIESIPRE